jgi:ubiquinone/menaquinone biosynthesis C-methylase UbiE
MASHVCPWWMGYFLAAPWRRFAQNPDLILTPYIREGMQILEIGPGMGFFTLPLARMVGPAGRIYAVDVQQKMLDSLQRRANKAGLKDQIETRLCPSTSLSVEDLSGKIDFALAFAVMHEIPDIKKTFREIASTLKNGGNLLIAEPKGHVSEEKFAVTVSLARECGLVEVSLPVISRSRSMLMAKN